MSRYVWRCPAEAFLREHYPLRGAKFVADALGITPAQVRHRARALKVKTSIPRGRPFESVDSRRHPPELARELNPDSRSSLLLRLAQYRTRVSGLEQQRNATGDTP